MIKQFRNSQILVQKQELFDSSKQLNPPEAYMNLLGLLYWNRINHITITIYFWKWEIVVDIDKKSIGIEPTKERRTF